MEARTQLKCICLRYTREYSDIKVSIGLLPFILIILTNEIELLRPNSSHVDLFEIYNEMFRYKVRFVTPHFEHLDNNVEL